MKKQEKHNYFYKSILIVLLSLVVFLLIIAIFMKIDEYKRSFYKINSEFKTNNIVTLSNKLPMSDTIAKNYSGTGVEEGIIEYKEFTITNPNDKKIEYEIRLTKISSDIKDIRSNYIKLYLTDENNKPIKGFDKNKVVSYYDLYSFENKPGSKILYSGSLVSGETKKFILRSWVADTYVLSNEKEGFSFDIDVKIK